MTAGFDSGGRTPRDWEGGVVLIRAGERVANVRRRLLLGEYDSDHVVREVARRMLERGDFAERNASEAPSSQRYN
jgi:hypothetical protein